MAYVVFLAINNHVEPLRRMQMEPNVKQWPVKRGRDEAAGVTVTLQTPNCPVSVFFAG